jgi:rod shape-determining protein MreD
MWVVVAFMLAVGLEGLRLALFARFPVHPDFLLGLVVIIALARRSPAGALMGFFLGAMRDIAYGHALGVEALPLSLVGWAVGSLGRSVYREAAMTQAVVLFLAAFGNGVLVYLILGDGEAAGLVSYMLRVGLPSSLLTAILVPLLINVVERVTHTRLRFHERKIFVKRD